MKTLFRFSIVFILIAFSVFAQKTSFVTDGKLNGRYWNEMEKANKNEFVLGIKAGIYSSVNYISQLKLEVNDSLISSQLELIKNLLMDGLWNSSINMDEIRKEIDNVYNIKKNEIIPIEDVSFVIVKFVSGDLVNSDKDYNINLLAELFNKKFADKND